MSATRPLLCRLLCCLVLLLSFVRPSAAQSEQEMFAHVDSANFVKATLMIAAPSTATTQSVFGHAFLRMQCPSADLDYCFSFETNDTQDFLAILNGTYDERLVCAPTKEYVAQFIEENRTITACPLNITMPEGQHLWQSLDEASMLPVYPFHDYFHHGCAQEIMVFVIGAIEGNVVFDKQSEVFGTTVLTIGHNTSSPSSLFRFLCAFMGSTDASDRLLPPAERCIAPYVLPEMLRGARIVADDGSDRLLLRDEPYIYYQGGPMDNGSGLLPVTVWLGLLLTLVVVVSLLEWRGRMPRLGVRLLDAALFILYSGISLLLLFVGLFSTLSAISGWCWTMLIFNPVPLVLLFLGRRLGWGQRVWRRIYLGYALWAMLYILVMLGVGNHTNAEQILLVAVFVSRCLFLYSDETMKKYTTPQARFLSLDTEDLVALSVQDEKGKDIGIGTGGGQHTGDFDARRKMGGWVGEGWEK